MEKLLEQHVGAFLLEPHIELHSETLQWLSELDFCDTEMKFLSGLCDKAFLRATTKKQISDLTAIEVKIKALLKKVLALKNLIIIHERQISQMDKDVLSIRFKEIQEDHRINRNSVSSLMLDVKKIKTLIFEFVTAQLKLI